MVIFYSFIFSFYYISVRVNKFSFFFSNRLHMYVYQLEVLIFLEASVTSRTLLEEFLYMATKTYKTKLVCLLVFKQRILKYLRLDFDISYDIKISHFDRIFDFKQYILRKCRILMKNHLLICNKNKQ